MDRVVTPDPADPPVGTCPDCETVIPSSSPAITYEAPDDWPRMVAECPDCGECVRPE